MRPWVRWAAVQFASTFCLIAAIMLVATGISRSGEPGFLTGVMGLAYAALMVLFYALHWRFQGWASDIDPVRSDRLTAAIVMRSSRLDPDW